MVNTFGPLMEVARIQSEINRLFDNLLDISTGEQDGTAWIPNADILETEDTLIVKVELPGVDAEHLKLSVHSGNVVLEGENPVCDEAEQRQQHDQAREERLVHSRYHLSRLKLPTSTVW